MSAPGPIRHLRWFIGGLLFLSTVINYLDRQTLSVLAPRLKVEFGWSNGDFAWLVIAFRAAYGGGQMISGRLIDQVGTRAGLSVTVACYSTIAALRPASHPADPRTLSRGFRTERFSVCRKPGASSSGRR